LSLYAIMGQRQGHGRFELREDGVDVGVGGSIWGCHEVAGM
jgi:hypothetical protein